MIEKIWIVLFFTFLPIGFTQAQIAEKIDYEQFKNFSIHDQITIERLVNLEGNWEFLKDSLGEPVSEDCKEGDSFMGIESYCSFTYDGLEINYTSVGNGVELSSVKITNDNAFLMYENIELRVDDSISKIAPLFPEAYDNRGLIDTNHVIKLNVAGSVANISFLYDPIDEKITEIRFVQVLT
ncbi:hypothetical protein [Rhodohalobacter sp. 8-1]|uniref:hypothetical protein n=1 Tax=Rhodohalobacter sp. 8-1 TaxID=3131972 RepID=UPI0030ECDE97